MLAVKNIVPRFSFRAEVDAGIRWMPESAQGIGLMSTEPHAFKAGPAALKEVLALDANLDAVICPTDIVAAGVLWDCARRGISVPERLGIIGWGDYEIAQAVSPKLTTIKPNPMEIGVGAVRLLLDGAGDGETRKVDTGYSLIERESA